MITIKTLRITIRAGLTIQASFIVILIVYTFIKINQEIMIDNTESFTRSNFVSFPALAVYSEKFHPKPTEKENNIAEHPCLSFNEPNKVWRRFQQRFNRVESQCNASDPSYKKKWKEVRSKGTNITENLIGNYQHHAINCLVLKAGSSSWNDFFWRLRNPKEWKTTKFWEKAVHGNAKAFKNLGFDKTSEMWSHKDGVYIVTARHPLAKIVSGYLDKFNKKFYYKLLWSKYPKMRKYHYRRWWIKGYFMQWQDFAQYLAEHGEDFRNNLDDHFYPIWGYCDPCSLPFNFFVKLDTFTEDSCWLFQHKFNLTNLGPVKWLNQLERKKKLSDAELIKEYYSKLKPEVVEKIHKLYKKDMLLFGYTFNTTTYEAGELET